MKMAVELVVRPRCISMRFCASGREDIRPCSCWKSSRRRTQLCFWAMLWDWNTLVSSSCSVRPVFITRNVTMNIRSFWLCNSFKSALASLP